MRGAVVFLAVFMFTGLVSARLETRMYSYGGADPARVEAQIRQWVPEGPRVRVNPEIQQVLVVADPETHARIADMLERIDQPAARLHLWFRRNREAHTLNLFDGETGTLPVSSTPPAALVEEARHLLPRARNEPPVVGSVLHVHVSLLRRNPDTVRLRVTPTVLFGSSPPYETAVFHDWATDILINTERYLDLGHELRANDFYRSFFLSQSAPELAPRPVGLLLSLEEVTFRSPQPPEEESP